MEFDDFQEDKSETAKILKKRDKIKAQLEKELIKMNFSDKELDEVFGIIDFTEAKIEQIKVSLNGTNINTDDPTPVMRAAMNEIEILQTKMAIEIRQKVAEIIGRKNKTN